MRNYKYLTGFSLLTALFIVSCTKMDAYRTKYMSKGAIDYTGKIDSVMIFSGNKRVEVNGIFTSDPNIVKYRVYWNGKESFMDFDVKRTSGVDTAKGVIPNLPEGTISFEIRTYDAKGDSSVPVYATGNVYGDLYQSGLINRAIVDASLQTNGSALITWADVSADVGVAKMEVVFSDINNVQHDTIVNSVTSGDTTTLPNFKAGSSFNYRTAYLPDSTCIDTFWVDYETHSVKSDVSSSYLSNYATPFSGTPSSDGRHGILGAPWIYNDAAYNLVSFTPHSGGWITDGSYFGASGHICWDSWGGNPVNDGRIYQVTSSPLPAGNYTLYFYYHSENTSSCNVYLTAASGNTGIPSVANISSALGYVAMSNDGTKHEESKSFDFTINTPQVISIGITGSMTTNNYFLIKNIALIKN